MKKIIAITAIIAAQSQAATLTNIVSGVDSFGVWITKINAGFAAAEPVGFTLYTTGTVVTATSTNAAAITNWTGSTLAIGSTVSASNGTATVLSGGIYRLRLTGSIIPDGTNTLQIYSGTNAIAKTDATFTGTNYTQFEIDWPSSLSVSNVLTVKIVSTDTNSPTLSDLKFYGIK